MSEDLHHLSFFQTFGHPFPNVPWGLPKAMFWKYRQRCASVISWRKICGNLWTGGCWIYPSTQFCHKGLGRDPLLKCKSSSWWWILAIPGHKIQGGCLKFRYLQIHQQESVQQNCDGCGFCLWCSTLPKNEDTTPTWWTTSPNGKRKNKGTTKTHVCHQSPVHPSVLTCSWPYNYVTLWQNIGTCSKDEYHNWFSLLKLNSEKQVRVGGHSSCSSL